MNREGVSSLADWRTGVSCLCGHFESCDRCRPRRLTRADREREDAAASLDVEHHPCVQLGDE